MEEEERLALQTKGYLTRNTQEGQKCPSQGASMYAKHSEMIRSFARISPWHLRQVGLFVQATINQHFEQVPALMADMAETGRECKYFTANKRRAFDALIGEAQNLFDLVKRHDAGDVATVDVLRAIVELPGFGIVKAGFWVQLALGEVGCLDRHHLRMAGMREGTFTRIPASAEALTTRLSVYVATCEALGGCEKLWDQWCTGMSVLKPQYFPTAEDVSRLHVSCIVQEAIDLQA
jgi:hypothetical protein